MLTCSIRTESLATESTKRSLMQSETQLKNCEKENIPFSDITGSKASICEEINFYPRESLTDGIAVENCLSCL